MIQLSRAAIDVLSVARELPKDWESKSEVEKYLQRLVPPLSVLISGVATAVEGGRLGVIGSAGSEEEQEEEVKASGFNPALVALIIEVVKVVIEILKNRQK